MFRIGIALWVVLGITACMAEDDNQAFKRHVSVSFTQQLSPTPLDGRLILIFSKNAEKEPRFQVGSGPNAAQIFGLNVDGLAPGAKATFHSGIFGFPLADLDQLPKGTYQVQAVLHKYDTFNLATGHTVKLPMDQGEGQQWNRSPGNLFSKVHTVEVGDNLDLAIQLDNIIPPIEAP